MRTGITIPTNGKFMRLINELVGLSFKRTFLILQDTFKI